MLRPSTDGLDADVALRLTQRARCSVGLSPAASHRSGPSTRRRITVWHRAPLCDAKLRRQPAARALSHKRAENIGAAGRSTDTASSPLRDAVAGLSFAPMFHVILFQPEIPPNTGNLIRLCANAGATLHLVHPLGFDLSDAQVRRAGLDYHEMASVREHADLAACLAAVDAGARVRADDEGDALGLRRGVPGRAMRFCSGRRRAACRKSCSIRLRPRCGSGFRCAPAIAA